MSIRRKVNGKYFEVREKDGPNGKKGTIMGKWSNKQAKPRKKKGFWARLFGL